MLIPLENPPQFLLDGLLSAFENNTELAKTWDGYEYALYRSRIAHSRKLVCFCTTLNKNMLDINRITE